MDRKLLPLKAKSLEGREFFIPDPETGFNQKVTPEYWSIYYNAFYSFRPRLHPLGDYLAKPLIYGTMGDFDEGVAVTRQYCYGIDPAYRPGIEPVGVGSWYKGLFTTAERFMHKPAAEYHYTPNLTYDSLVKTLEDMFHGKRDFLESDFEKSNPWAKPRIHQAMDSLGKAFMPEPVHLKDLPPLSRDHKIEHKNGSWCYEFKARQCGNSERVRGLMTQYLREWLAEPAGTVKPNSKCTAAAKRLHLAVAKRGRLIQININALPKRDLDLSTWLYWQQAYGIAWMDGKSYHNVNYPKYLVKRRKWTISVSAPKEQSNTKTLQPKAGDLYRSPRSHSPAARSRRSSAGSRIVWRPSSSSRSTRGRRG